MDHLSTFKFGAILSTALFFTLFSSAAHADPAADAKTLTDAFIKASASCDVPAVLELYEDNAVIIWPGQGDVATGKAAIGKVVKAEWNCSGPSKQSMREVSSDARSIGKDYILHIGQVEDTTAGPDGKPITLRIRTTELLHKSGGKWHYAVDHASIGVPPPSVKDRGKTP
jgi:ketosteroid isomerase-like protein